MGRADDSNAFKLSEGKHEVAANSKIEWTDHTFNPWIGCAKVSPACDNCYASVSTPARTKGIAWGVGQTRQRTAPSTWAQPLQWERQHSTFFAKHGRRQRVFCASLADVFDNEVDSQWLADLLELIRVTPNLDWLLLTKRIGNVLNLVRDAVELVVKLPKSGGLIDVSLARFLASWLAGDAPANVWLGATVVNQEEADRDIPKLLRVPATKRFLSVEPMLGSMDLSKYLDYCEKLDKHGISRRAGGEHIVCDAHCGISWVIAGGESGATARPSHHDWYRSLRGQCEVAGVPYFFKQWGEWAPGENVKSQTGTVKTAKWFNSDWSMGSEDLSGDEYHIDDEPDLYRIGKKAAGRLLDGGESNGFPSSQLVQP